MPPQLSPVRRDGGMDWYRPGESIREFHRCRTRIRALIGGRGSGKTTAIAVEAVGHGWHNAGGKIYILRKTQDSNQDTTQETFERQVFPQLGSGYIDTGTSLFKKIEGGKCFRLPSKKAVELFNTFKQMTPGASKQQLVQWLDTIGNQFCSFVYFAGVPSEAYRATRFRGYECSMLIFVEADQLAKEDLDMGVACLRWKGADLEGCDENGFIRDTCVILDTNPPSPSHWIAVMEDDAVKAGDKGIRFFHITTYENKHNLPEGYVESLERQYRKNAAMWDRMLLGKYADAFDGSPVLHAFTMEHSFADLPWPKGAYLVRGWDFGTAQAVVWSAYWEANGDEYWWDLYELCALQSDADRQCKSVLEITNSVFPFWNDRAVCAGVRDYCDPAGNQKRDTGRSISTLNSYGIFPGWKRYSFGDSVTIYNRLLEKKDKFGHPIYRIDKKCCPTLHTASIGGWRYPTIGEPGYGSDLPLKGEAGGHFDHVCFAAGTKVSVPRGVRAIQDIRPGDLVLTRGGARRVLGIVITPGRDVNRWEFSNGSAFWATEDHPVFVQDRGFVPLANLLSSDIVTLCIKEKEFAPKSEDLEVERIDDTRTLAACQTGAISGPRGVEDTCIGMFGNTTGGQSPRGSTYTTRTGTRATTGLGIWSAFLQKSIWVCVITGRLQRKVCSILRQSARLLLSGTDQSRAGSGTGSTAKRLGRVGARLRKIVASVVGNLKHAAGLGQPFAQTNVGVQTEGDQEKMTLSGSAPVGSDINRIATPAPVLRGVRLVSRSSVVRNTEVYSLEVEGEHEFFAEGILVSNCDAGRYAKCCCLRIISAEVEASKKAVGPWNRDAKPNIAKRHY